MNFLNKKGDIMQLARKNIYNRCVIGIAALIWVLGLLAAGSDSLYMPWLNIAGAIVFLLASIWLGRSLPKLEASHTIVSSSVPLRTKGLAKPSVKQQNLKINTRYAGGWSPV
jgi:hypothetical protein